MSAATLSTIDQELDEILAKLVRANLGSPKRYDWRANAWISCEKRFRKESE